MANSYIYFSGKFTSSLYKFVKQTILNFFYLSFCHLSLSILILNCYMNISTSFPASRSFRQAPISTPKPNSFVWSKARDRVYSTCKNIHMKFTNHMLLLKVIFRYIILSAFVFFLFFFFLLIRSVDLCIAFSFFFFLFYS